MVTLSAASLLLMDCYYGFLLLPLLLTRLVCGAFLFLTVTLSRPLGEAFPAEASAPLRILARVLGPLSRIWRLAGYLHIFSMWGASHGVVWCNPDIAPSKSCRVYYLCVLCMSLYVHGLCCVYGVDFKVP